MSEENVVVKQQDQIAISADESLGIVLTQKDAYGEEQVVWFNFEYSETVAETILRLNRVHRTGA